MSALHTEQDPKLEFFYMDFCPWCRRVEQFMKKHNITIDSYNVSKDVDALDRLERVGGKHQLPCLFIDGTALYESADIIAYLADHFHIQDDQMA